jgi:hypothetical protein
MDVEAVNKKLKEYHGTDDENRPIFRVVWSDSQIEKRFGTFVEHYGSIILGEARRMEEVPKYSYIKARWILEKLMFAMTDEVIGLDLNNRCYEPVYTFEDKFGRPLPVEWWAVEMIVKRLLGVMSGDEERMTQKDCDRAEDAQYQKELAYTEDVIADIQGGDVATKLGSREGIVVP